MDNDDNYDALKLHLDATRAVLAAPPQTFTRALRARKTSRESEACAANILEGTRRELARLEEQGRRIQLVKDERMAYVLARRNDGERHAQLLLAACAGEVLDHSRRATKSATGTYLRTLPHMLFDTAHRALPLLGVAALMGLAYFAGKYEERLERPTQTQEQYEQTRERHDREDAPSHAKTRSDLENVVAHVAGRQFTLGETIIGIDTARQEERVYEVRLEEVGRTLVSTAKRPGAKTTPGDGRTPENKDAEYFQVIDIQRSESWSDPFEGRRGAYGPYFARIDTNGGTLAKGTRKSPIGLHGTLEETLIGTRASHGCIRHKNESIRQLVEEKQLRIGTPVIIKEYLFGRVPGDGQQAAYCKAR